MRRLVLLGVFGLVLPLPSLAAPPSPPDPLYVDDEQVFTNLMDKLTELAKVGKLLPHEKLKARIKEGPAKVTAQLPGNKALTPEDVYKMALPSVFIVGSVIKEDDEWIDGRYATAWVLAADGVLVTNWHVFEEMEPSEVFGAADHRGNVYPVTDFLGGNKAMDVAIFRIDAKNLTPLPVARQPEGVAAWVAVLSHPGDQFYMFTQGHITRYSRTKLEDGTIEKWLNITAEYATGSSGGPVLNRHGAVVGMAAVTVSIDYPEEAAKAVPPEKDKPKDKPKEKVEEKAPSSSTLQMVVKLAVPATEIMTLLKDQADQP